jgi:hypothetical protein
MNFIKLLEKLDYSNYNLKIFIIALGDLGQRPRHGVTVVVEPRLMTRARDGAKNYLKGGQLSISFRGGHMGNLENILHFLHN